MKSNKGFSLIELIIVIAIMAVLIAVLAPQYLQYVEKTKRTTDASSFQEVVKAAEAAIADPTVKFNGSTLTVEVATGGTSFSIDDTDVLKDVCTVVNGDSTDASFTVKSNYFGAAGMSCVFTVDSNGNWTKTYSTELQDYVE